VNRQIDIKPWVLPLLALGVTFPIIAAFGSSVRPSA
jgi:hypothetical protein